MSLPKLAIESESKHLCRLATELLRNAAEKGVELYGDKFEDVQIQFSLSRSNSVHFKASAEITIFYRHDPDMQSRILGTGETFIEAFSDLAAEVNRHYED